MRARWLALVLLVLLGGCRSREDEALDLVDAYVEAARAGRFGDVYDLLGSDDRAVMSRDSFVVFVATLAADLGPADPAEVVGTVTTPADGGALLVRAVLAWPDADPDTLTAAKVRWEEGKWPVLSFDLPRYRRYRERLARQRRALEEAVHVEVREVVLDRLPGSALELSSLRAVLTNRTERPVRMVSLDLAIGDWRHEGDGWAVTVLEPVGPGETAAATVPLFGAVTDGLRAALGVEGRRVIPGEAVRVVRKAVTFDVPEGGWSLEAAVAAEVGLDRALLEAPARLGALGPASRRPADP